MSVTNNDELTAADVMTRTFLTAEPYETLGEVAEKLAVHDVGSVLVTDSGHLIGILTSRDIVRALVARVHPSEARVREWMSGPPETAAPETSVSDAVRTMIAGGFHHLPVTRAGRPIGVVGLRAASAFTDPVGLGL